MKTLIIFFLLIGWTCPVYPQMGQPNPSVRYAELLGYKWSYNKKTGSVDVTLPNGSIVDSWTFYRGEFGSKYSYCEKMGYELVTKTFKSGRNKFKVNYCVNKRNGNFLRMDRLMYENGDYTFLFPQGAPPPDSIPIPRKILQSFPLHPTLTLKNHFRLIGGMLMELTI